MDRGRQKMDQFITGNQGEDQFGGVKIESTPRYCKVHDCWEYEFEDGLCEEHQGEHSYQCDYCGDWFDSCYIGGLYAEDETGRNMKKACSECHKIKRKEEADILKRLMARHNRNAILKDIAAILLILGFGFILLWVAGVWDG